jgi:hypothetical protein
MSKRIFNGLGVLALLITFFGCTSSTFQTEDPKKRLSDYIARSFSIKTPQEKDLLLSFLTGEVKDRLKGWSDDQFREAFVETNRQFLKLAFKEVKSISPSETQITYEISYIDFGKLEKNGKKHETKVTNKKLCTLIRDKNQWYISEVKNIKELIEFKDELSLP